MFLGYEAFSHKDTIFFYTSLLSPAVFDHELQPHFLSLNLYAKLTFAVSNPGCTLYHLLSIHT